MLTGGTSGTPATFADFVTADRAGSVTLLAATAGLSPTLALTYQITPVELRALLISFVVASKTAEADYIFVTGTDFRDNAQTESIDVTAGNGTYVSTKYFRTITNIDCSDNSAGGGTQWANGTVAVTQPQWGVIWNYGGGQYQIDAHVDFGNGTTSTFFQSTHEQVYFSDNINLTIKSNATVRIGTVVGDNGEAGSYWSFHQASTRDFITGTGILVTGASLIGLRASAWVQFGAASSSSVTSRHTTWQTPSGNTISLLMGGTIDFQKQMYFSLLMPFVNNAATWVDVHSNKGFATMRGGAGANVTIRDAELTNHGTEQISISNKTYTFIDLVNSLTPSALTITDPAGIIKEQYSCNIHVADSNGVALQSATVLCQDKDGNTIFSVSTDSGGDITEQTVSFKQWAGTSKTETAYSPHKFTISKSNYKTLVMENITVDAPVAWKLELQGEKGGTFEGAFG